MKKIMAFILAAMMTVCCASVLAEGTQMTQMTQMTREDAMKTAVEYAGLRLDQVTFVRVGQDWDDGRQVFEIEFVCGGIEYEVEIDMLTWRVTEYSAERVGRHDHHDRRDWDDDRDDDWDDDRDDDWDDVWDDWFDFD